MNEDFMYYLMNNSGSLSIKEIVMNFLVALVVGFVIYLSYRFSHSGAVYSEKFNVSLWALTMVATLVMCVIGNNIALSLGMVGALSIVRFRTAIKDPRDTVYIFWAISAGVCCGISDYIIVGIGSVIIFCLLLFIGNAKTNERYLIVIRGVKKAEDDVIKTIDRLFNNKAKLKVHNVTGDNVEFIYEINENLLNKVGVKDVSDKLTVVDGVSTLNIVCQNTEIGE